MVHNTPLPPLLLPRRHRGQPPKTVHDQRRRQNDRTTALLPTPLAIGTVRHHPGRDRRLHLRRVGASIAIGTVGRPELGIQLRLGARIPQRGYYARDLGVHGRSVLRHDRDGAVRTEG